MLAQTKGDNRQAWAINQIVYGINQTWRDKASVYFFTKRHNTTKHILSSFAGFPSRDDLPGILPLRRCSDGGII
jgi:hypothetical protein